MKFEQGANQIMKQSALAVVFLILPASLALAAGDAAAGKAVYDKSCKSCHGADGTANPNIAKMMKVEIKDLSSADVQAHSDADLKKVVTEGQGKMKPIKTVAGKDVDNVIAYVRSLKK
jgi:mono/diheme cytochrome c family protein